MKIKIYATLFVERSNKKSYLEDFIGEIYAGPFKIFKDGKLYIEFLGDHYFGFIPIHNDGSGWEVTLNENEKIERDEFDKIDSSKIEILKQKLLNRVLKDDLLFMYSYPSDEAKKDFNAENLKDCTEEDWEKIQLKLNKLRKNIEVEFVSYEFLETL